MGKAAISFEVKGLKELNKALGQFEAKVQKKLITSSLRAGANIVKKAAANNAARIGGDSSRALSLSVGIKVKKFRGGPAVSSLLVGSMRSTKKAIAAYAKFYGPASIEQLRLGIRHGHLLELGTKNASARPWLRPALDSKKNEVVSVFKKTLRKKINLEVKRIARTTGRRGKK